MLVKLYHRFTGEEIQKLSQFGKIYIFCGHFLFYFIFLFCIYIYIYIIFHISLSDHIWQKGFVQEVTCTSQETFCFWYFQMLLAHHKGSLGEINVECKWKKLSE